MERTKPQDTRQGVQ